jgi:hypothetical protein
VSAAFDRFVLHEEDGLYGVYDRAGPQIYFASDREQAVREVARANEIVRLHPNTISMRHLREMDAEWRRDNGLPPLPEPEGRTIVVTPDVTPARPPQRRESPPVGAPRPTVAAVLDTAARVAERASSRRRVEEERESLKRTRALGRELTRAWAEAETSIARMRTALRELYGPRAREAEQDIRAALRSVDPAMGPGARTGAAERYLAATLPPPRSPAAPAARAVAVSAPAVAAWDLAADAAAAATGVEARPAGGDRARYYALLSALGSLRDEGEQTLATARATYSVAASGPGPRALREQWRALSAPDRAAVLQVIPEVPELARPPRARGIDGRSRGAGGRSR